MGSCNGDAGALVPTSDEVSGSPAWELRLLLERASELERLQRFEEALVLYHRGKKRAPGLQAFQEGVRRAEKAVQTAIGPGASSLFADIPGLLPGMIEEQMVAKRSVRRAARTAHERLQEAVRTMTFATSSKGGSSRAPRATAAQHDDDDNKQMQVLDQATESKGNNYNEFSL